MQSPFALIHHYDASDQANLILSGMAGAKADQDAYEEAAKIATYWSAALDAGLTPVSSWSRRRSVGSAGQWRCRRDSRRR
jgi:hypothetical protein